MTSETIMEKVKKILEKYPKARDNYNWLWYYYCRENGFNIYVPFKDLDEGNIPSVESITRAARKLWEEERQQGNWNASAIAPSTETQILRQENELRIKEWATKTHRGDY